MIVVSGLGIKAQGLGPKLFPECFEGGSHGEVYRGYC